MFITDLLALSHVPRWAIVPHEGHQSVSDHTFRVIAIFVELASRLDHRYETEDLIKILTHDLDESRTGDIPTPAKSVLGIKQESLGLSTLETERLFMLADLIEAFTFIEKYGKGYHASRVKESIRFRIDKLSGENRQQVLRLVDDIAFEVGR